MIGTLNRFRSDQEKEIFNARKLRDEAKTLREKVSEGSYGKSELRKFHSIATASGMVLDISNPELAERAGLGSGFFSTVSRDGRSPKLPNFLRALTAIIEVADERLFEVDQAVERKSQSSNAAIQPTNNADYANLILLASSLAKVARTEIERLENERPNDPDSMRANVAQRELFALFEDGFNRIGDALTDLLTSPNQPKLLRRASKVVVNIGDEVSRWWKENANEAVDWAVRIPTIVTSIAALNLAGANMTVGTTAITALVGGSKVLSSLKKRKNPIYG